MDTSSEMIHSLLPAFVVGVLGASAATLGLIEGVAEGTAAVTRIFSGALSDRFGQRKQWAVLGYGMAALVKPLFALAYTVEAVFVARFLDRVGKGIRGAPRDALVADLTPPAVRGASYGLRQSLDTVGAFAGPLLASALLVLSADDIRLVFWAAAGPAVLSVVVLLLGVREPRRPRAPGAAGGPWRLAELRRLGHGYWEVLAIAAVLTLARFSEAFLVLRAQHAGLGLALIPFVFVIMNVVYAASAYPAGALSDRMDRRTLLALGFGVLVVADLLLGLAPGLWMVLLGVAVWGLHMGLTQGLLAALVAETAPADLRGTAFGVFHCVSGVALVSASVLAGMLWDLYGPAWTFLVGAALTAVGLMSGLLLRRPFVRRGE